MDSSSSTEPKVAQDFSPMIRIYEDGRVERLMGTNTVPPSLDDPDTSVQSKDIVYSAEANLSSRLYLPKSTKPGQKLPVLVYYHGGAFCIETAFSPTYHNYLNTLVAEANVIALSVDYRRAPEHTLPAAYDDSWTALQWIASHVNGDGPEEWINCHADFGKVALAGDSAGANISHQMAMKYGQEKLEGIGRLGVVLVHPYFWGKEPVGDEPKAAEIRAKFDAVWKMANPESSLDDPLIDPSTDPKLPGLGCSKVLVIVAEKDWFRHRGWYYYENLKNSGWPGDVEIMEAKDEAHVFHLMNPSSENAVAMLKKISSFVNQTLA